MIMYKTYSSEAIESMAENINKIYKEKFQDKNDKALDIVGLVHTLGGRILEVPYVDIGVDSMSIDDWKMDEDNKKWEFVKFTVNVSKSASQGRKNFTIAHELGHLYLHFLKWEYESTREKSFKRLSYVAGGNKEREANMFAGALLMPRSEYKEVFEEYDGDFNKIANVFGVSTVAAEVRANVLMGQKGKNS